MAQPNRHTQNPRHRKNNNRPTLRRLDQLQESDLSATETCIAQFFAEYEPDRVFELLSCSLNVLSSKGLQAKHSRARIVD
ncbi:MAG: hypothetical protein ABR909_05575 [Candidatus Bathyarchaeia archaeon]